MDVTNSLLDAKILIVDDQPQNVRLFEMMLSYAGYANVQSTSDSREVEGLYRENDFDLIMLDIRMPHLDGFQVMAQLSDRIKGDYLPILVLTAQEDMETRLKALEAGAKDFVTKPFDRMEVLKRIHNMLEVRFFHNERMRRTETLEAKVRERTSELQARNDELERTRLEIVQRLGRAGEYRDNETGMHVLRMSKSCQRLALALGLSEAEADIILHASPMHDVGKIGIPDHILLKPGSLDVDEWETMKTHSSIGADIIGEHTSEPMRTAYTIASTHHEKWDGSGYPEGLKGEEIPIEGRIAAICDVFDALTSERPYKKAWPIEKATTLIHDQSGKHFDPQLVRLFDEVFSDILKIQQDYADED